MINCILDFDPGVDDAAALFAIKNSKNLKLLALSSVNGRTYKRQFRYNDARNYPKLN